MIIFVKKHFYFLILLATFAFTMHNAFPVYSQESDAKKPAAKQKKKIKKTDPKVTAESPVEEEKPRDKKAEEEATEPATIETFEYFQAPDYKKLTAEFFQKISQEIKLLESIYKKTPPGEARADILFRLADVKWLKAKYENLQDMERYQIEYNKFIEKKRKTEPKMPKFKGSLSLRVYNSLIKKYPKYSRLDEVLFLSGYHHMEIRHPSYYKYYEKLVKDYPRSRFNIDARMSLGEYYFGKRKLNEAVKIYNSVLAFGPSKVYNYALYKLGWCFYNQGQINKAIDLLKTVVSRSEKEQSKYSIELRDEALKNLVLFYSDMGQINEALAYFESVGKRDLSRKVLENLAQVYFDQSKFKSSIRTYNKLIDFDRMSEDVPEYYSKIIRSYQKSGKDDIAKKHMEAYVYKFEKGTEWYNKNKKDARLSAMERAEKYLRYLSKSAHEEAQVEDDEEKKNAKYVKATKFYRLYLSKFPEHENAYEMKYLLAEIYYQLEDYASASKYYVLCISEKEKTKFLKECSSSNIQSLTFLENAEYANITKKRKEDKIDQDEKRKYERIQFGTWAPKLLSACNEFIQLFPNDQKVAETIYQKARINYNYNAFDESMLELMEVINRYPTVEISKLARTLVLDIYGIKRDWDNILNWAGKFLKDRFFATPENKTYLYGLIQDATFKKALDFANNEQHAKAAEIFVGLQKSYPKSKWADKALFNAIRNYLLINEFNKATTLFFKLAKDYASSSHVPEANLEIANSYESRLQYANAAKFYEIFVNRDPKYFEEKEITKGGKKVKIRKNISADCLFNAALFRQTMEQYSKAIANYKKYISLYPTRKDIPDIHYTIALVYEKAKSYKNASQSFKDYYSRFINDFDKNVEARYKYIENLKKSKANINYSGEYKKLIHYFNSRKTNYLKTRKKDAPSLAARYAARSELYLLGPLYQKFEQIKFSMPQSKLKYQIETKAKLLKQLQDRYLNVVKLYGDSETGIESLYKIGEIYQDFSEALYHAPRPKGLTPELMMVYDDELAKQAQPLEQKSISAYEECLRKAFELSVYNAYTKKAYEKLQQFKPEKYKLVFAKSIFRSHRTNPVQNFKWVKKVEIK